jgi:hypothetical protein
MPKQIYDNRNKGVLFINEEKETLAQEKDTSKWADYKGSIDIEGVEYWVSGWRKTIKNGERAGQKLLSLAVEPKNKQPQQQATPTRGAAPAKAPAKQAAPADEEEPF